MRVATLPPIERFPELGLVLICIYAEPEVVEHDQATSLPNARRLRNRRVAVYGTRTAAGVARDRVLEQHVV